AARARPERPEASPSLSEAPLSLSIEAAMELAVARTEGVAAARAIARRASAQVRSARSGYLPQISGTASYERTLASEFEGLFEPEPGTMGPMDMGFEELPFGRENAWRVGLTLSQEIWSFGRTGSRVAQARAAEQQAEIAVSSAAAAAALAAARAYYDALLADELV